jgi:hypothetical protein
VFKVLSYVMPATRRVLGVLGATEVVGFWFWNLVATDTRYDLPLLTTVMAALLGISAATPFLLAALALPRARDRVLVAWSATLITINVALHWAALASCGSTAGLLTLAAGLLTWLTYLVVVVIAPSGRAPDSVDPHGNDHRGS